MSPTQAPPPQIRETAGPWKSVLATNDPFDDSPGQLTDARNCYIPAPGAGLYQRPGALLTNALSQLGAGANRRGQGGHVHVALDGTIYNFVFVGGKLYRVNLSTLVITDVTPVGPTINPTAARVFCISYDDKIIVSDGVNKPWFGTNLGASPITGTNIEINSAPDPWNAYGCPTVYGGALFFIVNAVAGVNARTAIVWSEPEDPATGYQQTNFDNEWTLVQTDSNALTAILGTNNVLYYFRQESIGSINGTVGINLASTATHDAIAYLVGTLAPASVKLFGSTIFFTDELARPWCIIPGEEPNPLWQQFRAMEAGQPESFSTVNALMTVAEFSPVLNLYMVATWASDPNSLLPPTEWHVFNGSSLAYQGKWSIGDQSQGTYVDSLFILQTASGLPVLSVLGSKTAGGALGYLWYVPLFPPGFVSSIGVESFGAILLESGDRLMTEGGAGSWQDVGDTTVTPYIYGITQRLGYDAERLTTGDKVVAVTGGVSPVRVTAFSSANAQTVEGVATPPVSQDGTTRIIVGLDRIQGRGIQIKLQPTDTSLGQWSLQRVTLIGRTSWAGVLEG